MSRICSSAICVPVGQAYSSRTAMAVSPVFVVTRPMVSMMTS
jgi:hypothetical protein